jgi:hypothetical protein
VRPPPPRCLSVEAQYVVLFIRAAEKSDDLQSRTAHFCTTLYSSSSPLTSLSPLSLLLNPQPHSPKT